MTHACRTLQTIALGSLLCLFVGCDPKLNTRYAATRGDSINGLSAFLQALRYSGLKVDTLPFATPELGDTHECIFIFDNHPGAIDKKTVDFWRKIAQGYRVSTMVWVVENGDATPEYWNALLKSDRLDDKQKALAKNERDASLAERESGSLRTFSISEGVFYGMDRPRRKATEELTEVKIHTKVNGQANGQDDDGQVHSSEDRLIKAQWPLQRRLQPAPDVETIWSSQGEPLLIEDRLGRTRFLVLASAIPLLNASLADPGNQELCEQLIELTKVDQRVAVIPNSNWVDEEGEAEGQKSETQSMLDFLKVQPLPWVVGQLVLALVLFCWWKFPILGRPLQSSSRELQRFGRHVEALGDLLRKARGRTFALGRIREWQRVRKTHGKKSKEN